MKITILPQPDDTTCGPTSLQAVYNYFDYNIDLQQLIQEVKYLKNGGTLAVLLGIDALKRGFDAIIHSYNLQVFDPTWRKLSNEAIADKLKQQLKRVKRGDKLKIAIRAYVQFLECGGHISLDLLTPALLRRYFDQKLPVLAGLSATYLYQSKREYSKGKKSYYDDITGKPMGHFVVLSGFSDKGKVRVADPYMGNPFSEDSYYEVGINRLLNSILLGIVTYDANLLIVKRRTPSHE